MTASFFLLLTKNKPNVQPSWEQKANWQEKAEFSKNVYIYLIA